jgi:phenylacetate-CoA ligase
LNEDVLFVETIDAGDVFGRAKQVIITDLYRQTQPFLRYGLNDVLEISNQPCECGSCFRVIKLIHGRCDDIFQLRAANGSLRNFFPDYVTRSINQASEDILEFQAIQYDLDHIEIRLELKPGANRVLVERCVLDNLAWWAGRVGGILGEVAFTNVPPERNPNSLKLIRVTRRF